jgi:ubiquinone/menaquinone biosynthesis C-methylase UbiE
MNDIDRERKAIQQFDSSADSYADLYEGNSPTAYFFNIRQKIIYALLNKCHPGRILDVGCGPGMMVDYCVNKGWEFFGVDISKEMIDECNKKFGQIDSVHFSVGKMQKLEFPDNYFDVVLCMGALEYVDEEDKAIAEISRVLKPYGLFIISCLNQASPYWLWNRWILYPLINLIKKIKRKTIEEVPHREFRERDCCRRLLSSHQLNVLDVVYYGFNIFLPPSDLKFPRLSVQTSKRLEHLSRSPLKWLAMAFIIKAKKS